MEDILRDRSSLFGAFIKSAQYIVRLQTQQDIWSHLGKFILTYFPANWTAFARRDASGNEISIHHCTLADETVKQTALGKEVRTIISEVLDSGFLATHVIPAPSPAMTAFLPIVERDRPRMVMLIGHDSDDPISKELLDVYLAIAGIAGSTSERLNNEVELKKHRAHLQELVKERTAELAKAKRQNDLILHSVGEGICGMDLNGNITFINPSAARILGWAPNEPIGRNAHTAFHYKRPDGSSYPVEQCPIHSALNKGNAERCANTGFLTNAEFVRKDGTLFPAELMTTPIIEEKKIVGMVMAFRDITERKQAEQALRRARDELELRVQDRTAALTESNKALVEYAAKLERLNEELQDFAFVASHDLQEPLRKIQTFSDMVMDRCGPALDGNGREYLDRVVGSAKRMRQLLQDLLQFSRIAAKPEPFKEIDLHKTALDAAQLFEEDLRRSGGSIVIERMPHIEADEIHMLRLFQTLVGNALKFRSDKSPRIRVYAKQDGKLCEIFVEDNGIGFDQQYAERIFKPFQRLHSREKYDGTGMGLSICRKIVEWHGGSIRAESKPCKGSTFIIRLPVRHEMREDAQWLATLNGRS